MLSIEYLLLNVRSKFGKRKRCTMALSTESYEVSQSCTDHKIAYIKELKNHQNVPILRSCVDHFKTFYSALRNRDGFNDNPDAREF